MTTLLGTAACTTVDVHKTVDTEYKDAADKTMDLMQQVETRKNQNKQDGPIITDRPWVSTKPIPINKGLPDGFSKSVTINEPFPSPIEQVLGKMAKISGIAMTFENDIVYGGSKTGAQAAVAATMGGVDSAGTKQEPQIIDLSGLAMQGGNKGQDVRIALSYTGDIKGMLDTAANAMRASWRYEEEANRVVFYRYLTKSFRLSMVPGNAESSSAVSTSSGKDSTTGGGQASSKFGGNLSVWKSVDDGIKTMLSSNGAYSVSEATGMITVRDVPDVVNRVEEFVKKLNDSFSRQVTIDVKVYRVENTQGDLRGINWNALFQNAGMNLNIVSPRPDVTGLGLASAVLSIPDTAVGNLRHWVGSQAFLDSLSKLGKTSVVTSTSLQTVNNQPAPIRIGRKIAYLKESKQTATANVGSTVTLSPGEVDVGFTMQILPHVQENGRDMLVQIMMTLSNLDSIETFSSGGSTIQLPQISSRDFMQRVWLSSGQALVLAGFETVENTDKRSGTIDAQAWPIGGSRDMQHRQESIVVVITPIVTATTNTL
jgi:type IVB pilus formation R64 PilN family outer membrane protein